jgi:hypothetical protein
MQLHIQDELTEHDSHRHIVHPFTVPEGATRIDVDFDYAPKRAGSYGNLLTLSLFDPAGERGTGHRGQPNQQVTIGTTQATPGYLPGPLPSGAWTLMVNTNLINPGPSVIYHADIRISFDQQTTVASPAWIPGSTSPRGPGWYRGDLHAHTVHSDGSWQVEDLVNFARVHGLDFVTLTDHNTISALQEMESYSSDDLLTMGGFELTTFYGHALALGVRHLIEWRVCPGERTMSDIFHAVEAAGGLFVIAHPMCPGDPVCTGCQWEYPDMMPGPAGVVEVWNEYWHSGSNNAGSVSLWHAWLNQGHRLAATVGTDIHGPSDREWGFNVVYAEALTEQAVLEGVRRGHLYMSSGPEVRFTGISSTGQTAMIGDMLGGEDHMLNLQWTGCETGDVIHFVVDGETREAFAAEPSGTQSWQLQGNHWCLIEIRNAEGHMRVLTNPIYIRTAAGISNQSS